MSRRFTRRALESWFPTIARYFGLVLLGYGIFVDRGRNPAIYPAAGGLILLKAVVNGGQD